MRRFPSFESLVQDMRYAIRGLVKAPGFSVVAVIILALGIGANTAIFSVVDAVLLRPLPFPKPSELVLVRDDLTGRQVQDVGMSVDELSDYQERSGIFDPLAALLSGAYVPHSGERIGLVISGANTHAVSFGSL